MGNRDIIVIGASAGGVESLAEFVAELPEDLAAAVFVCIHFPQFGTSVLPQILNRAGPLTAVDASDGAEIVAGRINVAPPDYHLLFEGNRMRLVRGPKEHGVRPSIDPMFRSAAINYGRRVIGVILTGTLDDGTSGLMAVKRHGGVAVVQNPASAPFPSMPESAIKHDAVDHGADHDDIPALLVELTSAPLHGRLPQEDVMRDVDDDTAKETEYAAFDLHRIGDADNHPGHVSAFSCPDCGGVLWELQEDALVRFRCRVGHAWSSDGLLSQKGDTFDAALWTALRALEESAALSRQIASRSHGRASIAVRDRFRQQAEEYERRAAVIRDVITGLTQPDTQLDSHPHAGNARENV